MFNWRRTGKFRKAPADGRESPESPWLELGLLAFLVCVLLFTPHWAYDWGRVHITLLLQYILTTHTWIFTYHTHTPACVTLLKGMTFFSSCSPCMHPFVTPLVMACTLKKRVQKYKLHMPKFTVFWFIVPYFDVHVMPPSTYGVVPLYQEVSACPV